jgi:hypothetical protein
MDMWQGSMEASGFPISFNLISGPVPVTEQKGQTMPSTVIKSLYLAVALIALRAGAQESDHPPRFLHDPVLGLRLPAASVKLDPMPDDIRAMCEQMADNATWIGRQWIFGVAMDSASTYYLVNGYSKRRNPKPGERLYVQYSQGAVHKISNGHCGGDAARETFDVRDPKQIPREVLRQLARDLAARLVREVGGADRLRTEITNQRIDFELLSPEIQQAFKPYFDVPAASAGAQESGHPPQFVSDPLLGLRLPSGSAKLEPMPEKIRAMCDQLADNATQTGRQWIFSEAKYPATTYYLVNGYFKLRNPKPGQRAYFQSYDGGVYTVSDGKCAIDEASETIDVRDPKQIPQQVSQQLAYDLAKRLVLAAGGADRLRTEITHQRIDFHLLSPEIQQAFKPYFEPAN